MAQVAVIAGRQRVVEDDAIGDGCKAAQFVQRAENVLIGRGPGSAATARVTGLGDPHLGTRAVGIALFCVQARQIAGHSQIILTESAVRLPVVGRHDGLQALGNAIIIMIAEYIQLFLHGLHQAVQRDGRQEVERWLVRFVGRVADRHTVRGAGADQQAIGMILTQPAGEYVVILGEQLGGVALGAAGKLQHVRLVDELCSINGLAVFLTQGKNLLGLTGIPRLIGVMQAVTVSHADQQLGTDLLAEVQHTQPLLTGQDGIVALGGLTAGVAVKVVIGLGGPSAGNAHPCGAYLLGQLAQLFIAQVNGIIVLHQGVFVQHKTGSTLFQHKLLLTGNLCGGVGFPEGSAGDLGHLNIVRDQACIDLAQRLQGFRVQFYKLCHDDSPFVLLLASL